MTARATLVASGEGRPLRHKWLIFAMATLTPLTHLPRGTMRLVAIETLLVFGALVLRARSVVQLDILMAAATGRWIDGLVTMRLMTIKAGLVRMNDDSLVRSLSIVVAI